MNFNNLKNKAVKAGILFSIAFGVMAFAGIQANAQWWPNNNRRDDRRDRRDDRRDDRRRDDRRDNRNNGGWNNGGWNNGGNNNGRYGGGYYNDMYRVARENGYRDGVEKGREEYREGDRYNPTDTRPYKNATNGYERRFGDKDQYKRIYREAFLQGFRQGYGNGRRNGGGWGW